MKNKLVLFFLFFIVMTTAIKSQTTLKIEINNLKNNKGFIIMDFRDGEDKPIKEFFQNITDNKCEITINNLKPGKYSFKYFHDENNNKELDTYWFGAPKEAYGFSNNAKGKFGPPSFEDTVFEIDKNAKQICTPTYINF